MAWGCLMRPGDDHGDSGLGNALSLWETGDSWLIPGTSISMRIIYSSWKSHFLSSVRIPVKMEPSSVWRQLSLSVSSNPPTRQMGDRSSHLSELGMTPLIHSPLWLSFWTTPEAGLGHFLIQHWSYETQFLQSLWSPRMFRARINGIWSHPC